MLTCFEIDGDYVSEVDQFLQAFDQKPRALSSSQQEEIEKFRKIDRLRDEKNSVYQKR